eukprot:7557128-Alexandrium_andersonii.AAC.1
MKLAGWRAGGASGEGGGQEGSSEAGLRKGISIEPNRSAEPNTMGTEPTEPSTSLPLCGLELRQHGNSLADTLRPGLSMEQHQCNSTENHENC